MLHRPQVGVKHEYDGSQGCVCPFFGSLGKEALEHFRVGINDCDHLQIQKHRTDGLLDNKEDSGCSVTVRTQVKLMLLMEAMAPFDDALGMIIIFQTEQGERHEYPLRPPIVATCFMKPATLEANTFMIRWRSLEGQERKCQEVVKTISNAPSIDENHTSQVLQIVTEGLNFGCYQGYDPTPWTISGAATFWTGAKDRNGNNINIGCLLQVEANPQAGAFR